jgi:hypothetical protein
MSDIEVTFDWDEGDRSVGLFPGWGEETGAVVRMGDLTVGFVFIVAETKPVAEWVLDDVWVRHAQRQTMLADAPPIARHGAERTLLGELPDVCAAVAREWERIGAEREAAAEAEAEAWAEQERWLREVEAEEREQA